MSCCGPTEPGKVKGDPTKKPSEFLAHIISIGVDAIKKLTNDNPKDTPKEIDKTDSKSK